MIRSTGSGTGEGVYRFYKSISPYLHQVVQCIDLLAPAVPVPKVFGCHIDQAVMFPVPVIRPVSFEYAGLIALQIGEQIGVPCLPDLLFTYAGHLFCTLAFFIRRFLLSLVSGPHTGAVCAPADKTVSGKRAALAFRLDIAANPVICALSWFPVGSDQRVSVSSVHGGFSLRI